MTKRKQSAPAPAPPSSGGFRIVAEPRKKPDVQMFADVLVAHVLDEMEREKNGGKLKGEPRSTRAPFTTRPIPKRKDDQDAA